MSRKKVKRSQILAEIEAAGRKMSTFTVLFHQAIAEKAGLSGTDHKYLDILFQEGSMTAGQLAELAGLTTGAVTGLIDRLEKQGLVKRESAPDDRRKVIVVPQTEAAMQKLGPVFTRFQQQMDQFYESYSDEELEIVKRYLLDTVSFFSKQIKEMKESK